MRPFHRRPRVQAVVGDGFLAAEAPALQTSIVAALDTHERTAGRPMRVELHVERGAGTRLVLSLRNIDVGFVPPDEVPLLAAQIPAGKAVVVVPGVVHRSGDLWRVWVGEGPADGVFPAAPEGLDTLPVPEPSIAGIPLKMLGRTDREV
ncbi:hypothetical protein [Cellulomonas biazotea]|uniref:Uncharacterized protein n=1 Tax=Cellulomonas biazotea TaxID=1709 RepID=A0A402DVN4_9CELL|nr:hypothetical protein [Cellulomonas biazotea]GCE78178.1 hypothetical protein CBZ_32340 [Cellulomonas biazotea]